MRHTLFKGCKSKDGQVEIIDSDSLCYIVKNNEDGKITQRIISNDLLNEYVDYFEKNPNADADQAKKKLGGKSGIDSQEYKYSSMLTKMAKMILWGEGLRFEDKELSEKLSKILKSENFPYQLIYYGAPGTGKSHRIKRICREYEHYRITFHPDTDYASFVGSYKPTVKDVKLRDFTGKVIREYENEVREEKIIYTFVKQVFLNAYIAAWREQQNEEPKPVFLIIEEINRGNCAQIFGDIFQLLDRSESGFSDYSIVADEDLKKVLAREFENIKISNADAINRIYNENTNNDVDIVARIKNGSHLLLPNNLYIWATMNTSDQSLFPIDSAFKRRWDWKYVKISDAGKNYRIKVNYNEYDWWTFVKAINEHIGADTSQEDKKLGYFFAKATKEENGKYIISADTFLSKVIYFIYNDVYKDFGFDEDFFKGDDGEPMSFASYFDEYGEANEEQIERFICNLGLDAIFDENDLKGKIRVVFKDDKKVIFKDTQADTLRETIKYLGLKEVEELGIICNGKHGFPLLSRPDATKQAEWESMREISSVKAPQKFEGDYWLVTDRKIEQQAKLIEELIDKLGREAEVTYKK